VIAGDRGLSGAYNTSALRAGERLVQQLQREGASVRLYCVGKKAPSFYRFRGMDVQQSFMGFVDRPSFSDARLIASVVAAPFIDGEVQKVLLVSTRFHSAGSQGVETEQLLPLALPDPVLEDALSPSRVTRSSSPRSNSC